MITVTFCGMSFVCAKAIKGPTYIRLVGSAGELVASFENVNDFSGFAISNGSWTDPDAEPNCRVALLGSDGTLRPSEYCHGQHLVDGRAFGGNIVLSNGIQFGAELPATGVEGQLFFKIN